MTIEEQLTTLLATAQEHTKQLEMDGLFIRQLAQLAAESQATTQEHTKQLEMDGLFIRQLAQLAAESREDFSRLSTETREEISQLSKEITRMTNALEALMELNAHHETRLNRLEGNE
jgi:DNA-binding MarR family transcriptional regulator